MDYYKTYLNYSNETGFNQVFYPVRDSIAIINPFFVILFGVFAVLTVGSYYVFATFTGRTRFFNSLIAGSFSTFVISIFFSLAGLITPYHVLTFIGITVVSYILVTFYK